MYMYMYFATPCTLATPHSPFPLPVSPPLAGSEATTEPVGQEAWLGVPMATALSVLALAGEPETVLLALAATSAVDVVVFVVLIVVASVVLVLFVVGGGAVVVEETAPVAVAAVFV